MGSYGAAETGGLLKLGGQLKLEGLLKPRGELKLEGLLKLGGGGRQLKLGVAEAEGKASEIGLGVVEAGRHLKRGGGGGC